jgi:hypothetical protein
MNDRGSGEVFEEVEYFMASLHRAAGEFTDDEWVAEHLGVKEKAGEPKIGHAQMVDPDRCIGQNHADFLATLDRRRGTERAVLSEPPNVAKRLALSRATSASKPALTTAVFSVRPLNCVARPSNASSMFSVVRICISMAI